MTHRAGMHGRAACSCPSARLVRLRGVTQRLVPHSVHGKHQKCGVVLERYTSACLLEQVRVDAAESQQTSPVNAFLTSLFNGALDEANADQRRIVPLLPHSKDSWLQPYQSGHQIP